LRVGGSWEQQQTVEEHTSKRGSHQQRSRLAAASGGRSRPAPTSTSVGASEQQQQVEEKIRSQKGHVAVP
jgi:hypothetical protein